MSLINLKEYKVKQLYQEFKYKFSHKLSPFKFWKLSEDYLFNKIHLVKYIFFVAIIGFALGCNKFVVVPAPDTQLVTSVVYSNDATATSALTGIYGQMLRSVGMFGQSPNMTVYGGLSSDELKNYSTNSTQILFYTNNLTSVSGYIGPYFWGAPYNFVYQANAVLEGLNSSTQISPGIKQELIGEAKFIRAFCFFYLVNLFGDIPLALSTNYNTNNSLFRAPKDQVYQQIIADLKDAQINLSDDYITFTNGSIATTTEKTRPNKSTATALLGRVYLYTGDWVNAEVQSSAIINNSRYKLLSKSNINSVFTKASSESIWDFQGVGVSNINTYDGLKFILTATPTDISLSQQLMNSFEVSDSRKDNWIGIKTVGPNSYYFAYKYKVKTSSISSEYLVILRLAEQFLIRAEARAHQGNIIGSQYDLNLIRNRAGLSNTSATDTASLLLAIEHERQVELFAEWGHRWFDLKRTNRADAILGPIKGNNWQSTDILYPIPQSEIQNNPHLVQNPGY